MPPANRNEPKRAASSDSQLSLMEFMREFPDDAACLDYLWRSRYAADGHTAECPSCARPRRFHRVKGRPAYDCDTCGHHLHPTAGTIFHKSSTSLHLWFYAIWLITSTRCGVSAKQLERELGVTYKTAWRMFNKIRNELMEQDYNGPLGGEVEADETFVGGRLRHGDAVRLKREGKNTTGPASKKREIVFAVTERGGRVVALHVASRYAYTLRKHLRENVKPYSSVYTDDYIGYKGIDRLYQHASVNHSAKVYVDGHVHTQTVEGFFSTLKNGIRGVYHSVSPQWLQGYLNEYAWRYNHRTETEAMFRLLLQRAAQPS